MSKCLHTETEVTDSRPPGHINSNGYASFKRTPYTAICHRRRKCLICGERIKTVEILKEEVDRLFEGSDPFTIRQRIKRDIINSLELFLSKEMGEL